MLWQAEGTCESGTRIGHGVGGSDQSSEKSSKEDSSEATRKLTSRDPDSSSPKACFVCTCSRTILVAGTLVATSLGVRSPAFGDETSPWRRHNRRGVVIPQSIGVVSPFTSLWAIWNTDCVLDSVPLCCFRVRFVLA